MVRDNRDRRLARSGRLLAITAAASARGRAARHRRPTCDERIITTDTGAV
jgi:hypothetical protein